jgi:hypothetical protein
MCAAFLLKDNATLHQPQRGIIVSCLIEMA